MGVEGQFIHPYALKFPLKESFMLTILNFEDVHFWYDVRETYVA